MGFRLKRRWVFLGLMLCFTLAAAAWVGQQGAEGGSSVVLPESAPEPAKREAPLPKNIQEDSADLALHKPQRAAMDEAEQNVFAGKSWYVPPPPPKDIPPPAPTAPPLPFTYMGKFQDESGRLVIYLVKGDRAYVVSGGEEIENTYRIEGVEAGQVIMTYLPLAIKQVLQFGTGS